jgi:hypothetical protein
MHFLPQFVVEMRGNRYVNRRFHFWDDVGPWLVWKWKNDSIFSLHNGQKSGKIRNQMRERTASRLGPPTN